MATHGTTLPPLAAVVSMRDAPSTRGAKALRVFIIEQMPAFREPA